LAPKHGEKWDGTEAVPPIKGTCYECSRRVRFRKGSKAVFETILAAIDGTGTSVF
jgi:hypothetical protein